MPAAPRGAVRGCWHGTGGWRQGRAGTGAAPGQPPGTGHAEGERACSRLAQRNAALGTRALIVWAARHGLGKAYRSVEQGPRSERMLLPTVMLRPLPGDLTRWERRGRRHR